MQFIAHVNDQGEEQPLKNHLFGVAKLARQYAQVFHAGELAYIAGLLHDLGKYKEKFQRRIRGHAIQVTHSTAGALEIGKEARWRDIFGTTNIHKHLAQLVQFAIAFHHGGLKNYGTKDEDGSLCQRLSSASENPEEHPALWEAAWKEIELPSLPIATEGPLIQNLLRRKSKEAYCWKLSFLGRMLYSCLVDADTIDTRTFCNPVSERISDQTTPTMAELSDRLSHYLKKRFADAEHTLVNRCRKAILETCQRRALLTPQLFSLSVPTGGGKTFSSLAFALRHAVEHKLRRVIYVIPFTSIIEQNAAQFRDALGPEAVLEHHSNFSIGDLEELSDSPEYVRYKWCTENWDKPVIVTTSVQFFESLFSNKRSKCRKLHNIARSVIILDEAQSLPRGYLEPCLRALEELVEGYGCSVVLCTATQPSWPALGRKVEEIMDEPSPRELFDIFKRTSVEIKGSADQAIPDETLAAWMLEEHQVLCIVNTRKHAKKLLDHFDSKTDGLFHLSGRMTPRHRMAELREIRNRLKNGQPCRVISTQLIEAGVDVDFPVVFRALAGIDSIAQASGRCNREGKLPCGRVIVFHPEPHGMPARGWLKETAAEAMNSLAIFGDAEALSLACINDYFERIHGVRDEQAGAKLRDQEGIVEMLTRTPPEFPYQDAAERFRFIDSAMETVIVPWLHPSQRSNIDDPLDAEAWALIESLPYTSQPGAVLRQLQPYVVQIYQHELLAFKDKQVIQNVEGIWVLHDLSYYDDKAGLLPPDDEPESAVYIF